MTRQGLENRIQNLIKQVKSLSTWVMGFDPLDYMNSADAANVPLMDSVDETAFRDFTDQVLGDLS